MSSSGKRKRVLIMGAAGRDFHNFNVAFRDDPGCEVVAFTAAQIPGISGRRYPAALAGDRYPDGIAILEETQLADICREKKVDEVVFAYSDVEHAFVMHKASIALAAGADFTLLGPKRTMLTSRLPVIAICAVRTGVGKSQTARWLARLLKERGLRVAVIRHPMPYGDLERQAVQRFASLGDLDAAAMHHRGARGVRTAHPCGQHRLCRRRLRPHPRSCRDGGGHHRLGWRQQRFPVRATRSPHRSGRPAAARP